MVIIVLSVLVLVAIVGLAIDGGSAYSQRRRAQNSSDAVALAGTRKMLSYYETMVQNNPDGDVNGSRSQELSIRAEIDKYAALHGIITSTDDLKVFFVNDTKQVVTAILGDNCGVTNPCQVGHNNIVPWAIGAKGIYVTNRAQTDSFFMAIIGFNKVSAVANTTAYMGVAVNSNPNVGIMPIGFFTDTVNMANLQEGREYTIISGGTRRGAGNWGYVDFNGQGNPAPVVNAWIACGFNPSIQTANDWSQWCSNGSYSGESRAVGPTEYYTGMDEPLNGPLHQPVIEWPDDPNGWWIAGSSGTTNSTCQIFDDLSSVILNHDYLIPVFDRTNGQGGNNTKFHLIGLVWFHITTLDIQCHPVQGEEQHWAIRGTFLKHYSSGSTGKHGDVRHTSNPVVFLEP